MRQVFILSLMSGLATGLGGLVIVLSGKPKQQRLSIFLAFATGIMIAVIVFDLLPTAFMYGGMRPTGLGFILGLLCLSLLDQTMALIMNQNRDDQENYRKLGYLIAIGIALHDLPEGLAIAVSYNAQLRLGLILALAIALHNIPEGMAVAAPLKMSGSSNLKILFISLFISLFTPLGACLGFSLCQSSGHLIALFLALAAGAMTYIIKDELLPLLVDNHPVKAQLALLLGFGLIFLLTFQKF